MEHVGRYASEFGLLEAKDYANYSFNTNECKKSTGKRYYFTATEPLGGFVGGVSQPEEIQWELFRNGPVAVSVLVDDKFYQFDPYGEPRNVK